jgi:hypothetical protein
MASLAARASAARNEELPPGFEALGAGMAAGSQPTRGGGAKNKKKKGGRVTPPKQR